MNDSDLLISDDDEFENNEQLKYGCPLIKGECLEANCEWWSTNLKEEGQCIIYEIAGTLYDIQMILKNIPLNQTKSSKSKKS